MARHTNFQQTVLQVLESRVGKTYAQDKAHEWKQAGIKSDGDVFLWATSHLDPGNLHAVMAAIGWASYDMGAVRRLGACIRICQAPLQARHAAPETTEEDALDHAVLDMVSAPAPLGVN